VLYFALEQDAPKGAQFILQDYRATDRPPRWGLGPRTTSNYEHLVAHEDPVAIARGSDKKGPSLWTSLFLFSVYFLLGNIISWNRSISCSSPLDSKSSAG